VKTLADAPYLDILAVQTEADPGAVIESLRSESWVVRTLLGGMVIGRAQVQALLADRRLRSAVPELVMMQGVSEGDLFDRVATSVLAMEGEPHARLRRLVNRALTPRAVDVHRPDMRETLHRLVDPLQEKGECDFMTEVSEHYPIEVMCHLLGVPDEDHAQFAQWNRAITWALSLQLSMHVEDVMWGMSQMEAYVADLMVDRRKTPRDDLVTALVHARDDNDQLTDDEILSMIAAMLFAGYDTTRNQLGLAMWLFAQHPAQWEQLRRRPDLAPRAVEEVMRVQSAVGATPRLVVEDIELDGFHLATGTLLMLSLGAANNDPGFYTDPRNFDITVEREPHMTFGGGVHYCLGASLARAEMQEALPILAAAMPDLALGGEPTWRPPTGIYGPETLPITFSV
jgi:cytochrome P450